MSGMIPVALFDRDTHRDPALLRDLAEAMTHASQQEFGLAPPFGYGIGALCRVITDLSQLAPGEWLMDFAVHPNAPNALGDHDVAPNGQPAMHVFPLLEDADQIGVTSFHELAEALADYSCCIAAVGDDERVRAYEPGDPVETDSYPHTCASGRVILLSNYVLPAYFSGGPGPYDRMNLVRYPGEIRPGGYQSYFAPGVGWTQEINGAKRPYRQALDRLGVGRHAQRVRHYARKHPPPHVGA